MLPPPKIFTIPPETHCIPFYFVLYYLQNISAQIKSSSNRHNIMETYICIKSYRIELHAYLSICEVQLHQIQFSFSINLSISTYIMLAFKTIN